MRCIYKNMVLIENLKELKQFIKDHSSYLSQYEKIIDFHTNKIDRKLFPLFLVDCDFFADFSAMYRAVTKTDFLSILKKERQQKEYDLVIVQRQVHNLDNIIGSIE